MFSMSFAGAAVRGGPDLVPPLGLSGCLQPRGGRNPSLGELEEVVGGANGCPFGADVVEAAQQELAEAARLFDLPENRLRELVAQPIGAGVPAGLELCAHRFDAGRCGGRLRL